jgi:hypothetical protein
VGNEANRAFCEENGDFSNPRWSEVEDWRRSFAIDGAKLMLSGGSPEDLHDLWRSHKQKLGWQHGSGAASDPVAKTTPNMVPYAKLTEFQKKKNELFAAVAQTVGCGVERWDVKTLTDSAATQVNLTPQPSTIAALIAIPAPSGPTSRVDPEEFTTYQLTGSITLAKRELDSDIHMVLTDDASPPNTMIIEAPCPSCAQNSVVANQISAVRQAVEQQFPAAAAGQREPVSPAVPVIVTGVGFFDRLHGQEGVAPNGIELHPVLSFILAGSGGNSTS